MLRVKVIKGVPDVVIALEDPWIWVQARRCRGRLTS